MTIDGKRASARGVAALLAIVSIVAIGITVEPATAAFPGKPGKIAFVSTADSNFEIFSMNPDGSGVTRLTTWEKGDEDPAYSPDGNRIAFARATAHLDVWVMNADGTGATNLMPLANDGQGNTGRHPAWSPDGTRIAYSEASGEIWTIGADGTGKVNLTNTPVSQGVESDPTYSPEGDRIAYLNSGDLWVMDANGGNRRALATTPGELERAPDWSPDGSEIVFQRGGEIWKIDADGTNPEQLVGAGGGTGPTWSPDGTQIAFSSSGFGAPNGPDIIVMNADGSSPTRIAGTAQTDYQPNWQPIVDDADLHVELTDAPDPVEIAGNVTYTATITNESEADARFATLYGLLPTRSTYVSATPSQGSCRKTSLSITCSLGRLDAGATATVTFVVTASNYDLSFSVHGSSSQGDPDPTDNIATEETTVEGGAGTAPDPTRDPRPRLKWSVPDRLRDYDGDGILDEEMFNNPKGAVVPFKMVLDGCDSRSTSQISQYGFAVTLPSGDVLEQTSPECRFTFEPPKEGTYPVTLSVTTSDERTESLQEQVPFRDLFIVSFGDSVASGEGNPDKICDQGCHAWDEPESWQSRRCHRSAISGPSRAAQALESSDWNTSVTFVHLACSGATVKNGIAGPYRGIEPPDETSTLPSQASVLKELMDAWDRKPDAVLVSIGANDAQFADAVTKCLETGRCFKDGDFTAAVKKRLARLPGAYENLDRTLDGLKIPANKVFLTEYFNPTRDQRGEFSDCMAPLLVPSEWEWAEEHVIEQLNLGVKRGVERHGWNLVSGIASAYRTHGMCANDYWVVKLEESYDWQGDINGSFHPNVPGHVLYGRRIVDVVRPKLIK